MTFKFSASFAKVSSLDIRSESVFCSSRDKDLNSWTMEIFGFSCNISEHFKSKTGEHKAVTLILAKPNIFEFPLAAKII